MSGVVKECVFCGQSCAGQPRIKDAKGRYAHRACAEQQQQAKQAEPDNQAMYADDGFGDGMDDLWDDIEPVEQDVGGAVSGCPGCGNRLDPSVLVCVSCGFNVQSGKAMKTRTLDTKKSRNKPGTDSKAKEIGADIAGLGLKPVLPIVGAAVGGAIGAMIWAALVYFTSFEMGYVAILVGALCGYGARMGGGAETTGGGMIAGMMAAGVAVLAIGTGKYVALNMMFDREFGSNPFQVPMLNIYDIEESNVLGHMAYEICDSKINAGEQIAWGDPMLPISVAEWPDDYPMSIQDGVVEEWDAMSDRDQLRYRRMISDDFGLHSYRDVEVEWAWQIMADEMATVQAQSGVILEWPDPRLFNEAAAWPDDYPQEVQDQVNSEWVSLSAADKDARKQAAVDAINDVFEEVEERFEDFTFQLVIEDFKSPIQALFVLLAIGAAYGIGSNDD